MIELEEYKQSSQSYERAYKEQVIISQKATSDKDETTQDHREQVRLLNIETENAQPIQIHEKRDEENQRTTLETKGMFNLIKLYTWCVSFKKFCAINNTD
jgi:hypothetical protein